jgi:transposase
LQRQIAALGHDCTVVAPSLVPVRAGNRVKTNRRDAVTLARLHRAGELTAVWVPDPTHEAMRDLVRARTAAMEAVRRARQQLQGFLLRHGRVFTGRKTWSPAHRRWLAGLRFAHPAQQIVLQEHIDAIAEAERRRDRLEQQIREWCRTGRWHRWSRPCRRCAALPSSRRWCWRPRSGTFVASPAPGS